MELKAWFILSNEKISGPYKASEVLEELTQGQWYEARFWAKGKSYWMTENQFREEVSNQKKENELYQSKAPTWFLKEINTQLGPFNYDELIQFLKKKPNYKSILVSQNSATEWKEVYQIESIMDKLGVNRRKHPRIPIDGMVTILDGLLRGQKVPLTTLSQGGLGMKELKGFSIGEKIKGVFSGPQLKTPIHFQGEIIFIQSTIGNFGIKFTNISAEGTSQIIAYIKQFVEANPEQDFQKIA